MSIGKKLTISSSGEMKEFAKNLAKRISKQPLKKGAFVIGLEGELGSGKTTFAQGFAKGLNIKEKILSPTFVIMKRFEIPKRHFYHIDCYRINSIKEMKELNLKEIIFNPNNIVVIEWAERIKKVLPKDVVYLKMGHKGGKRTLTFVGDSGII